MSSVRKRKQIQSSSSGRGKFIGDGKYQDENDEAKDNCYPLWLRIAVGLVGVVAMVYCGKVHAGYMYQIHENNMWFTQIKVRFFFFNNTFNLH